MPTIFICYKKKVDKVFAIKLYNDLKRFNFDVWLDEEKLLGGEDWKKTINKVLPGSTFVLIILSKSAIDNRGYFHQEIKLAIDNLNHLGPNERYIIPLRLDDIEPEYEELKNLQWIDFFSASADAKATEKVESYESGFRKLIKSIRCAQDLYQIVNKKELVKIYEENLIAYLPLQDDLRDISEKTISVSPVRSGKIIEPKFDELDGLLFDGSFIVQIKNRNLPFGTNARTFCFWCKFWPEVPQKDQEIHSKFGVEGKNVKFLFSYGDVMQRDQSEHGRAFGVFYGFPFFQARLEREFGFRIFMWCAPLLWDQGDRHCDTGTICSAVSNNWYFFCVSYDGEQIKSYVNNQLLQVEKRDKATRRSELLNIGGFLPHLENDYDFFNFEGYIREFIIFNKVLSEPEINQIYNSTKELLCCKID